MAHFVQLALLSLILFSLSEAKLSPKPKALLLPVSKDPSTLQYTTHFTLGTPAVRRTFVVDLGGENLWMSCETGYKSSTYRPGRCGSAPCSVAKGNGCFNCNHPPRPGCTNNTCSLAPENTVRRVVDFEELAMDTIKLPSTDGSRTGPLITIPNFIFACARNSLLEGLANGAKGMAGLGWPRISLPTHFSSAFGGSFRRKFALCLPSTPKSTGVLFFGDSPYQFYPSYNKSVLLDITRRFSYTRLYINPMSTASAYVRGEPSSEYFLGVKSIVINGLIVPINPTLLSINSRGVGGTKISTVHPYTVLETSIYKSLTELFGRELNATNAAKVAAVAPFTECFSKNITGFSPLGNEFPVIEFVFEEEGVSWGLNGANKMVEVSRDVVCLGFVDGGVNPRTSVVIGAHQIQDNLLQFDLASSRLGFSLSLLWEASDCGSFNF